MLILAANYAIVEGNFEKDESAAKLDEKGMYEELDSEAVEKVGKSKAAAGTVHCSGAGGTAASCRRRQPPSPAGCQKNLSIQTKFLS